MTSNNTIGQIIREERKYHNLTQQQLGDLSGTGLNFISQLENGKATVRFDKLLEVLKVLGLSLELTRGKDPITTSTELGRED